VYLAPIDNNKTSELQRYAAIKSQGREASDLIYPKISFEEYFHSVSFSVRMVNSKEEDTHR
jgi:hypothetical protein